MDCFDLNIKFSMDFQTLFYHFADTNFYEV